MSRKTKLLIVDDERLILAALRRGLVESGYDAVTAETAKTATEIVKDDPPDLAILDIRLPESSGVDLGRKLAADFGVPFILLTAFADEQLIADAATAGALGYLIKPIEIVQLIASVESALERSREFAALKIESRDLTAALGHSRDISMAVGLLMERERLDRNKAFAVLRETARRRRTKIEALAKHLLDCSDALNFEQGV